MRKARYGIGWLALLLLLSPALVRAQATGASNPGVLGEAESAISDAALTTKVKSILATNKITSKYKLHVSSNQGVVTLSGHIGSSENAHYAAGLVRRVNGVRAVSNHLQSP